MPCVVPSQRGFGSDLCWPHGTDHPPSPTYKGLELLVGGVGLSAPHLVLSAALNRQKQPWFGRGDPPPPTPHPNQERTNGDQVGAWRREIWAGSKEASAGDLRCSSGLTPCARARVLQKNRTSRRYRLGVGWGWSPYHDSRAMTRSP